MAPNEAPPGNAAPRGTVRARRPRTQAARRTLYPAPRTPGRRRAARQLRRRRGLGAQASQPARRNRRECRRAGRKRRALPPNIAPCGNVRAGAPAHPSSAPRPVSGAADSGPASRRRRGLPGTAGVPARTSPCAANTGGQGANAAPFPSIPRRAATCGQDARAPRPRLRRGRASPGAAACQSLRAPCNAVLRHSP